MPVVRLPDHVGSPDGLSSWHRSTVVLRTGCQPAKTGWCRENGWRRSVSAARRMRRQSCSETIRSRWNNAFTERRIFPPPPPRLIRRMFTSVPPSLGCRQVEMGSRPTGPRVARRPHTNRRSPNRASRFVPRRTPRFCDDPKGSGNAIPHSARAISPSSRVAAAGADANGAAIRRRVAAIADARTRE